MVQKVMISLEKTIPLIFKLEIQIKSVIKLYKINPIKTKVNVFINFSLNY